ncbi:hypothetical protein MAPG_07367 [Magnaporthiopsis poae ATCC 64411]|uniref:Uncharacterized protein n=1 Tax=Magnaporthiopsis poae (strain ATCC 64411 / 73-15) TaxID=644358 RepID=A0A0C4E4H3_MAGP6|nr:hypothetical protein MAPG_07367 [Magnaporthiopsis poae ATCC 64411]
MLEARRRTNTQRRILTGSLKEWPRFYRQAYD